MLLTKRERRRGFFDAMIGLERERRIKRCYEQIGAQVPAAVVQSIRFYRFAVRGWWAELLKG